MDLCERCQGLICDECRRCSSTHSMPPPRDVSLPFFAYGALKPGMPAFHLLRGFVAAPPQAAAIGGHLLVRDGLPLLQLDTFNHVDGFLLRWQPGRESEAYSAIGRFEPKAHYQWSRATIQAEDECNVLTINQPTRGSPQHLLDAGWYSATSWSLIDDPAFGPGLDAVQQAADAISAANAAAAGREDWLLFFQCQMAYLLLWSILERLSALCIGPLVDPTKRIHALARLDGMAEAVRANVVRTDKVCDSREPKTSYTLDPSDPLKTFKYFYQVRSNLSHRGKAVWRDFDMVHRSLAELLGITRFFLDHIKEDNRKY